MNIEKFENILAWQKAKILTLAVYRRFASSKAKGSCGEVRSMLCVALELNYGSKKELEEMSDLSIQISKMLSAFIKTL